MKIIKSALCSFLALLFCCIITFGLLERNYIIRKFNINFECDYSDITYFALGDSITYGYDGSHKLARHPLPYPDLVASTLGFGSFTNYGISGSTLTDNYTPMSVRFSDMGDDADIVSVLGGVNDFLRNIPLGRATDSTNQTIYGALNILAGGLKTKFPNSFVFFMTPYKCQRGDGFSCETKNKAGYSLEQVANAIKEVAATFSFPVLDLYSDGLYENVEMYSLTSDKLHPSQKFFQHYTAPQISNFIIENFIPD